MTTRWTRRFTVHGTSTEVAAAGQRLDAIRLAAARGRVPSARRTATLDARRWRA